MQWPWQQTGSALCVIDCGTALTVDVIDDGGRHLGGWIMAGLATARASLLAKHRACRACPRL
jgi:type III pantothenate kinase